jgi:hypothetical protein
MDERRNHGGRSLVGARPPLVTVRRRRRRRPFLGRNLLARFRAPGSLASFDLWEASWFFGPLAGPTRAYEPTRSLPGGDIGTRQDAQGCLPRPSALGYATRLCLSVARRDPRAPFDRPSRRRPRACPGCRRRGVDGGVSKRGWPRRRGPPLFAALGPARALRRRTT